jgi:hypothetical protein
MFELAKACLEGIDLPVGLLISTYSQGWLDN